MAKQHTDEKGRPVRFITTRTGKRIPILASKYKGQSSQARVKDYVKSQLKAHKSYQSFAKGYKEAGRSGARKGFAWGSLAGAAGSASVIAFGRRGRGKRTGKLKKRTGAKMLTTKRGIKALARTKRGKAGLFFMAASAVAGGMLASPVGREVGVKKYGKKKRAEYQARRNK